MSPGDIGVPRTESPGGGEGTPGSVAVHPLIGLGENIVDPFADELGDRQSSLRSQHPQPNQLLFGQLYLGSNHDDMMA